MLRKQFFLSCFPGWLYRETCFGRKICVREAKMFLTPWQKHFLFSEQKNLFPQHTFPARLNWETFASATMFPSLARPLYRSKVSYAMQQNRISLDCYFLLILKKLSSHSSGHLLTVHLNLMEFKVLDVTAAKTSLKIASLSLSIFFFIMSVCLTFES